MESNNKISGSTFLLKKLIPGIWFGFCTLIIINELTSDKGSLNQAVIILLVIIAFFFLLRETWWRFSDKVYDKGNYLRFYKGSKEQIVELKDIVKIEPVAYGVVIHTKTSGDIGNKLFFIPQRKPFQITYSQFIKKLRERVEKAGETSIT